MLLLTPLAQGGELGDMDLALIGAVLQSVDVAEQAAAALREAEEAAERERTEKHEAHERARKQRDLVRAETAARRAALEEESAAERRAREKEQAQLVKERERIEKEARDFREKQARRLSKLHKRTSVVLGAAAKQKQSQHCHACGEPAIYECGECGRVAYCTASCQAIDWSDKHRAECDTIKDLPDPVSYTHLTLPATPYV